MAWIAFILVALNPVEDVARDSVDVVEVNGFYDEQGRLVFDQLIWWDWQPELSRYQVRAWRLVKDGHQLPTYDHETKRWKCLWNDGETTRSVTAASYRRTWEQFDPELADREVYPKERRRELSKH